MISMENPCIDRALLARQGKLISRNSPDRYGSDGNRVGVVLTGYPLITFLFLQRQMTSLSVHTFRFLSQILDLFVVRARTIPIASSIGNYFIPLCDMKNINSRLKFLRDENRQRSL